MVLLMTMVEIMARTMCIMIMKHQKKESDHMKYVMWIEQEPVEPDEEYKNLNDLLLVKSIYG